MVESRTESQNAMANKIIRSPLKENEARLESTFNSIDTDGKGSIDVGDISEALKKLNGAKIPGELEGFIHHTNKKQGNSPGISITQDHDEAAGLFKRFRRISHPDISFDGWREWLSGNWWRHLVAGGVAGAVSRTCTAPLNRIKTHSGVWSR